MRLHRDYNHGQTTWDYIGLHYTGTTIMVRLHETTSNYTGTKFTIMVRLHETTSDYTETTKFMVRLHDCYPRLHGQTTSDYTGTTWWDYSPVARDYIARLRQTTPGLHGQTQCTPRPHGQTTLIFSDYMWSEMQMKCSFSTFSPL